MCSQDCPLDFPNIAFHFTVSQITREHTFYDRATFSSMNMRGLQLPLLSTMLANSIQRISLMPYVNIDTIP